MTRECRSTAVHTRRGAWLALAVLAAFQLSGCGTAPTGATVMLDGNAVTGFQPVGSSGFSVARVSITGGQHTIVGSQAFGIVVYGFGRFTSYMYPGGLDLEVINLI
jgi:hypothetical protein